MFRQIIQCDNDNCSNNEDVAVNNSAVICAPIIDIVPFGWIVLFRKTTDPLDMKHFCCLECLKYFVRLANTNLKLTTK